MLGGSESMIWPISSTGSLMGEREASRGGRLMQRRQGGPVVSRSSLKGTPCSHWAGGRALVRGAWRREKSMPGARARGWGRGRRPSRVDGGGEARASPEPRVRGRFRERAEFRLVAQCGGVTGVHKLEYNMIREHGMSPDVSPGSNQRLSSCAR